MLWWKVISTINTPLQTLSATTVDGQEAVRWQSPSVPANAWIYTVAAALPGATLHATVTVKGKGTVFLNQNNGVKDADSAIVTLSDTPRTLSVTTGPAAGGGNLPEFQVRTPAAETGVDVTMWNIAVDQSAVTGRSYPVAGAFSTPGYSGDRGPAGDAQLNFPAGVAVAPDGSVYIADTYNNRICRLDAGNGQLRTVAGTGTAGYSGDGGPATLAALRVPQGIAADAAGNLYIADSLNHRVRAVKSSDGTITTVAGTGVFGTKSRLGPATAAQLLEPLGVAVTSSGSDLYIVGGDQALMWVTGLAF